MENDKKANHKHLDVDLDEWMQEIDKLIEEDDADNEAIDLDEVLEMDPPTVHSIKVDEGQLPRRIDKFLQERLPRFSRSRVQEAIKQEKVFVNNKCVKANYRVRPSDDIVVEMPESPMKIGVIPEKMPINIVYEDDDLLVVNKPAGLVVHPGFNNWTGTLVNGLAYYFDDLPTFQNGEDKPGIVHRIDKDTSGLLLVAKNDKAMRGLAKQFHDHSCERTYYALVWGHVEDEKGTIDANLGRDSKDRRMRTVYEDRTHGKHAITHYEVIKRMRYVTLIKCKLETGRTHQIRVHMRHIGHSLFQDIMYGGTRILKGENTAKYRTFVENCFKILPRQALHAKSLGFKHPVTQEWHQFDSELPEDFATVLKMWEEFVTNEDQHL